jgi:hypothetical protein
MKEKNQLKKNEYYVNYKKHRNSVVHLLRLSKIQYYNTYFQEHKKNAKRTWDGIKAIININKKSKTCPSKLLDLNNNLITTPESIANAFNDYFSSVGNSIDSRIRNAPKSFRDYMPSCANDSLYLKPTDRTEIFEIISSLITSTATGPHSIPTKILKIGSSLLAAPISLIVNQSFKEGIFPDALKLAKVIPVYKSGSKEICSNYRPISLLSNLSKIIEKATYTRLYEFFERSHFIYDLQFGFRKHHSTEHALLNLTSHVYDIMDRGDFACGLFLDLQKAFDTVNYKILLQKLEVYGVRGVCLSWFSSYLNGRKQYVAVDDAISNASFVNVGVPQGSILGPLLFLIYINDFHRCLSSGIAQHFADDTVIVFNNSSLNKMKSSMSCVITKIEDWLCANRLSLNAAKTEILLFRPNNKSCSVNFNLKILNKRIFLSNKVKYLGVVLDSRLSWRCHLSELAKKLSRANGLLLKIRYFVDAHTIKSLYYSLFHSHMTYGCLTWGVTCNKNLKRISNLQRRAIRIITFSCYGDPTSNSFSHLKILKLEDEIKFKMCLFMHDWHWMTLPRSFEKFYAYYSPAVKTRMSEAAKLSLPMIRTDTYGRNNIKYRGATLFNQLRDINIYLNIPKKNFRKVIKSLLTASYT